MDRTTPRIRLPRIAALAAVALLIAFAAAPALPSILRSDDAALARLAAPALAESGDDDEVDVTGGASVEASPTPTPEPTLPPGVTATPTPSPAPRGAGWPFANWAVVGIYVLVALVSLPLLFRRRARRG